MSLLLWVGTGLFIWWHIPACRRSGWVVILAGLASFGTLAMAL